jgi:hypothetical protein
MCRGVTPYGQCGLGAEASKAVAQTTPREIEFFAKLKKQNLLPKFIAAGQCHSMVVMSNSTSRTLMYFLTAIELTVSVRR